MHTIINLKSDNRVLLIIDTLRYKLTEANIVTTPRPMDPNVKLVNVSVKEDSHSKKVDAIQYLMQSMVGSLLHAARATRPGIA